jgi:hypothetical protein
MLSVFVDEVSGCGEILKLKGKHRARRSGAPAQIWFASALVGLASRRKSNLCRSPSFFLPLLNNRQLTTDICALGYHHLEMLHRTVQTFQRAALRQSSASQHGRVHGFRSQPGPLYTITRKNLLPIFDLNGH